MKTIVKIEPSRLFKIVGVGNAGTATIECLSRQGDIDPADLIVIDSDEGALAGSTVGSRFCMGVSLSRGMGAGGDPALGRSAAQQDTACIKALCADTRMVFLVAGLGGGVGTGATPVIAQLARESNALVIAVVTQPFEFEGSMRRQNSQVGLKELKAAADAVICLPNQRLMGLLDERTTALQAFAVVSQHIAQVIESISSLLTRPGLMKVDFSALERMVRGRHLESAFAFAEARGDGRSRDVVEKLCASPFLDDGKVLANAESVLVNIAGGPDLALSEMDRISRELARHYREGASVLVGTSIEEELGDRLRVTLIVTRRPDEEIPASIDRSPTTEGTAPLAAKSHVNVGSGFGTPMSPTQPRVPAGERDKAIPPMQGTFLGRAFRGKKGRGREMHPELNLFSNSRGRFENTQATIHENQNLDDPTFLRRNIALN